MAGLLGFAGLRLVTHFALLSSLWLGLLAASFAPAQAAGQEGAVALPERGQLLRDALYLERDIDLLQERLSPAGPRALVFYIDLDPAVLQRFQAFIISVDGHVTFEQVLSGSHSSTEHFKQLHRMALAAGEHSVEVRLVGEDSYSELLEFTKGAGRDHISVHGSSPKATKAPTIELAHEQWRALQ